MWLSIMGMYETEPSIFEGLELPVYIDENEVIHKLNRNDVINNIVLECAELEVVYPSIQIMKFAIGVWSASNQDTWNKLYASQLVKYNPIWNVDAIETETETNERDISRQHTGANTETPNLTNTESVQGFNSNQWSEAKKNVQTGTDNITITNNENVNDDNKRINSKRRTGNIGVTASQDLIKKEREIADFSIIEYITQSFKERFCILVY